MVQHHKRWIEARKARIKQDADEPNGTYDNRAMVGGSAPCATRYGRKGRAPRARNSTVYGGSSTCHWRRCRDIPDDICLKEIN